MSAIKQHVRSKSQLLNFRDWLHTKKKRVSPSTGYANTLNESPYQTKVVLPKVTQSITVQHHTYTACPVKQGVEQQKEKHRVLSLFMICTLSIFTLYTICLPLMITLKESSVNSTPMSLGIILFLSFAYTAMMLYLKKPLAYFGLTFDNAKSHIFKALYYTSLVCLLLTVAKFVLLQLGFGADTDVLFSFGGKSVCPNGFKLSTYLITALVYFFACPLQELVARGIVQTLLYHHLPGQEMRRRLGAIIIPNLLFCAMHAHLSLTFAALVFIPGLFWGALFYQQRSMAGVVISHLCLGFYGFFILGSLT